ncbi:MAG: Tex family protein [Oscillospiraceae bacterium]|nr:Tex family protein [Oscillospiraceae bacterium]
MEINKILAQEFKLRQDQIDNTIALFDDSKTIPFVARYRKEATGSLDDQILRDIFDRMTYLRNLEKRKQEIISLIDEQGKLTDEISLSVLNAATLVEAEDIYRPFKPKRKTRASVAKERGLAPLADSILEQNRACDPENEAQKYINEEKEIKTASDAINGAMDIIAEAISDDADLRKQLRSYFMKYGVLTSKAADENTESVYENYYDFSQPVAKAANHRILALDRGENEGILKVSIASPDETPVAMTVNRYCKNEGACAQLVELAAQDSYKRLIFPAIEREIRSALTLRADEDAIKVFAENLRQLLLQPPIKNTVTLGLDPGFRTGCKVAVVDHTGKVLYTDVVHISMGSKDYIARESEKLKRIIQSHKVNTIAIGNGTASRESEAVVADIIKNIPEKVSYMVVSEAGASVYSASKLAAEEFPEYDVSLRSAVSIARRLQDPLAELVKIDPKAIGVGQYQHDMPKARMSEALGGVVEACVNSVGVDLNTSSHSLLSYVAGINSAIAKNIVTYREENGAFTDRKQLLKVPKLGKKAFEQCAGFLRVRNAKNPLDNTAVHPESYESTMKLIDECGFTLADISEGRASDIKTRASKIGIKSISDSLGVGVPTLNDIISELQKPGRDLRDELPAPIMRSGDIMEIKDLREGMELVGTVRNVIDFGAFVDIGVHEDGLVHISQICDRYIKHPLEAVKVGQVVKVRVIGVDVRKKRISLTMKV